jgi:hypothetical protein
VINIITDFAYGLTNKENNLGNLDSRMEFFSLMPMGDKMYKGRETSGIKVNAFFIAMS